MHKSSARVFNGLPRRLARPIAIGFGTPLRALASLVLIVASLGLPGSVVLPLSALAQAGPCAQAPNPVLCENSLTGNPASEWDVSGGGDNSIQGFATDISVNKGQQVNFKVKTASPDYRLDIYRLGYYGGDGARKIATVQPSAALPQNQPSCLSDTSTGLIDCGNWDVSASWAVPDSAVSGIHIARLVREDNGEAGKANHVPFIVRDDNGASPILFQTSDTTWHAYNAYGGNSLYQGAPAGRAYKVSYNRPFINRAGAEIGAQESYLFTAEYPMVRWLERNGYNVSYTTGVDTDRRGGELLKDARKIFLSVGHDEYWSAAQRANVEAAREAGKHLAFFSGNEVFWKTRWENDHRTLVSYKETHPNSQIDPDPAWTGTWRDPRGGAASGGGRPENELTGTLFMVNGIRNDAITVPAADGKLRFWRGTSIANLSTGQATLPPGTLGYEWDEDVDNGYRPAGAMRLSSTTVTFPTGQNHHLLDFGSNFGPGTATHSLMLYRDETNRALVFGAGTTQWSWGLDTTHDRKGFGPTPGDSADMQRATMNLFADMGVQPGVPPLNPATPSADMTRPTSIITSAPQSVMQGNTVAISGTASDTAGPVPGQVAGVEVSTDNGATWHPATGRAAWSYDWTPIVSDPVTLRVRAVDDSGNLENPGPSTPVMVTPRDCATSCTIWPAAAEPNQFAGDSTAFEVGTRFRSDVSGWITGVRFYKGPGNTGTHVGHLWSNGGQLLGSVTFSGETSDDGWQAASFPTPVAIAANTTYVVSYKAPNGHYARDVDYFDTESFDNVPLHALRNGLDGFNGVFGSPDTFPNQDPGGTNYWVDVTFTTTAPPADTTPPAITGVAATNVTGFSATIRWTSDDLADSQVEFGTTSGSTTSFPVEPDPNLTQNHAVTLIDLRPNTAYVYRVKSKNTNNLVTTSPDQTFTTGAAPDCPCTIFGTTPASTFSGDTSPYELGVKFRSDMSGFVHGIRFFKGPNNTGTHVGNLWTTGGGPPLASVTFSNETATGWQMAMFATPVEIDAGTTYIASYHAPQGGFADNFAAFQSLGVDNPPLHALRSGVDGRNGVFVQSSVSAFPFNSVDSNYWVDVVFDAPEVDSTAPIITNVAVPTISTSSATITWTTNEPADTRVEYGTTTGYGSATPLDDTDTLTHSATLNALSPNTLYHFRVNSKDAAGNLATATGSFTTTQAAQANRSLQLNGTTAYAEAPNASELNVTGDWTFEAWFKDENQYGYFHLPETLLIKGDLVRDREIPFGIGIAAGALFVVEKANNNVAYTYYDLHRNQVSANTWHHVAATVQASTRTVTIYLDGVQKMQSKLSRGTSVGNDDPVTIGRNGGPTGHANFKGKIDDVRIWNRVRSASEISGSYKTQFTTSQNNLVANWRFDEGTGTVANDSSGVGTQHATLKNGATWSTDVDPNP